MVHFDWFKFKDDIFFDLCDTQFIVAFGQHFRFQMHMPSTQLYWSPLFGVGDGVGAGVGVTSLVLIQQLNSADLSTARRVLATASVPVVVQQVW